METGFHTVNQQRKLSERAERVSACGSSGLRVKTWCRENGVSEQMTVENNDNTGDVA